MLRDKDIREPLFFFLEETFGKVRFFEEKNMGDSRADIVMIMEDAFVGIEIKSDADTYTRLETQVKDYDAFFDYNIIAVGTKHAEHVSEHVPDWWGIITVESEEDRIDCYFFREPKPNPKLLKKPESLLKKQIGFLWRPELAHIQETNGLYKYAGKSKKFIRDYLLESFDEKMLKHMMIEELFERDYDKLIQKINEFRANNGKKPRVKKRAVKRKPKRRKKE